MQVPWGSPTWGLGWKFCPLPLPSPWIQGCSKGALYFYTLEKLLNFLPLKTPLPLSLRKAGSKEQEVGVAEPSCSGALWGGGQPPWSLSPLVKVLGLGAWLTDPGEALFPGVLATVAAIPDLQCPPHYKEWHRASLGPPSCSGNPVATSKPAKEVALPLFRLEERKQPALGCGFKAVGSLGCPSAR